MSQQHEINDGAAPSDFGAAQVLVVDDDRSLQQLVAKFLRSNGYTVLTAQDGREMHAYLRRARVDLIVLDVMLPGTSGIELLRDLRKNSAIPIIMLTAQGHETDRILGLELGADDYLSKPFNPRELLARIRSVLRRSSAVASDSGLETGRYFLFDSWKIDTLRRELSNAEGVNIELSTSEYDLLQAFINAPQRVLTRDQLLDAARNRIATGFDRSIDVQVSRLRRKIDGDGDGNDDTTSKIKTIRGQGYMFMPEVSKA
jgi:two-component system, OmpR family, response regulator